MIHRHFDLGQILNGANLNEMFVLIDRTETELTELALNTWRAGLVGLTYDDVHSIRLLALQRILNLDSKNLT